MEIVLEIETKDLQKVKDILLKDDAVSRASITFKEGSIIDKKNYFCYISGLEEHCKKAIELTKDLAKEAKADKEKIINKIKEEESKATEAFGSILG